MLFSCPFFCIYLVGVYHAGDCTQTWNCGHLLGSGWRCLARFLQRVWVYWTEVEVGRRGVASSETMGVLVRIYLWGVGVVIEGDSESGIFGASLNGACRDFAVGVERLLWALGPFHFFLVFPLFRPWFPIHWYDSCFLHRPQVSLYH